jgi:hypothetical protein
LNNKLRNAETPPPDLEIKTIANFG